MAYVVMSSGPAVGGRRLVHQLPRRCGVQGVVADGMDAAGAAFMINFGRRRPHSNSAR
jgi:hypothetical protein